jgi:hypothetical protein
MSHKTNDLTNKKRDVENVPAEQQAVNKTTTHLPSKHNDTSINNKPVTRLNPVRYGDWEKNGRCIDF